MRISDWSSDVCSSDLQRGSDRKPARCRLLPARRACAPRWRAERGGDRDPYLAGARRPHAGLEAEEGRAAALSRLFHRRAAPCLLRARARTQPQDGAAEIEEHHFEPPAPIAHSYAVFVLKKK